MAEVTSNKKFHLRGAGYSAMLRQISELVIAGKTWYEIDAAIGCSVSYSAKLYRDGIRRGIIEDSTWATVRRRVDLKKALMV